MPENPSPGALFPLAATDPATRAILNTRLLPLFYTPDTVWATELVRALTLGGVEAAEFTQRGAGAQKVFETLRAEFSALHLGAGTVLTAQDAARYCAAGADFIVSPCFLEDVAAACRSAGVPYYPGAQTVREVVMAHQAGAPLVKLFPGEVLGPAFVRALRGPLPSVPLLVTGGVDATAQSLNEWYAAGVQAVGLGSRLIPQNAAPMGDDLVKLSAQVRALLTAGQAMA